MAGCVLRVTGSYAELANSLKRVFVRFEESRRSVLRRERDKARDSNEATFNYTVSEADGDQLPQQIRDAEAFLSRHAETIRAILSMPGVAHAMVDFGWTIPRESHGEWNRFPESLLSLCASAGLDIEVSVYPIEASGS